MNQNDVMDAFRPDFSRKHGCAWFVWGQDAVRNPEKTGGWASIGGEPAFQFQRPQDLPKDVVWWTNLSKSEAWSLGRWSHIKHSGFLGPDWLTLMSEWGFPQEIEELKKSCASWSEVFARIAETMDRWSASLHESGEHGSKHPTWSWGDGEFYEAVADKLDWTIPKESTHPALAVAYCDQIEQELQTKEFTGKRKVAMVLPRVTHARKILTSRYPVGDFEAVESPIFPSSPDDRWKWIEEQTLPILVRFDEVYWAHGFEKEAALWWGLRGRRFAGAIMDPVWMTAEEALDIRPWIESGPSAVLRGTNWKIFDPVPHWPQSQQGFLHDNSIVTGLLNEALWRAAATPVRTPTKRIKSGVSARSVWWRAADRRQCFRSALHFAQNNFTVLSYGQGAVTILFDSDTPMQSWSDTIVKTGVKVPKMLGQQFHASGDITDRSVDIWLKSTQSLEAWLFLDRLLWPWWGQDPQALKTLMAQALRSLGSIKPPSEGEKEWLKKWKDELLSHSRSALKGIVVKK